LNAVFVRAGLAGLQHEDKSNQAADKGNQEQKKVKPR
jgi:hypothetical protein